MAAGNTARITFHGDLAYLARRRVKGGAVDYTVDRRASVKDVVEALGVPHTEVYGLTINGAEADFNHLVAPGEAIEVRGASAPVDVTVATGLRPEPLPGARFLADENVGKLATLLRLLGLDTDSADEGEGDEELAERAAAEKRIVLSRDVSLLKRKAIVYGRLVRAVESEAQLAEVLDLFGIGGPFAPFTRCLRCNVPLTPVAKAEIIHRLEPKTKKYFNEFHICPKCRRIYWPGSHHDMMRDRLTRLNLPAVPTRAQDIPK